MVESVTTAVVTLPPSQRIQRLSAVPGLDLEGVVEAFDTIHYLFEIFLRELFALEQRQEVGAAVHDLPGDHERRLADAALDGDEVPIQKPYVGPLGDLPVADARVAHGTR